MVAGEFQPQNEGDVHTAVLHGTVVAETVSDHGLLGGSGGGIDRAPFDLAGTVRVGAYDNVHAVSEHQIRDFLLRFADFRGVLAAPVQGCDDHVRLQQLRLIQNGDNPVRIHAGIISVVIRVEKIHAVLRAGRNAHAAEPLGKGDKRDADAVDFPHGDAIVLEVLRA